MEVSGTTRETLESANGERPDVCVAKRQMFLDKVGIPIAGVFFLLFGLSWVGHDITRIGEHSFWPISWGDQESWNAVAWTVYYLSCIVYLVFGSLWNKMWRLRRTCTRHVDFGSGEMDCSDPELLTALSPGDFLGARPVAFGQSVAYRINTQAGMLAVHTTFEDMVAWMTARFGTDSVLDTVCGTYVPQHLSARRQPLMALTLLGTGLILLPSSLCTMYFSATLGTSAVPGFIIPMFLCVLLLAIGYYCLVPGHSITLNDKSVRVVSRSVSKNIPFDSIRGICLVPTGFKLVYSEGGVDQHAGIGQLMYAESLLPLYFILTSHAPEVCVENGESVAVDVAGVPIP